jgi:hypothetical protein
MLSDLRTVACTPQSQALGPLPDEDSDTMRGAVDDADRDDEETDDEVQSSSTPPGLVSEGARPLAGLMLSDWLLS